MGQKLFLLNPKIEKLYETLLNIIAKTSERYFKGVVRVTSASLYDCVKSKLAILPSNPIKINKIKSYVLGIIHLPNGTVNKPPTPLTTLK